MKRFLGFLVTLFSVLITDAAYAKDRHLITVDKQCAEVCDSRPEGWALVCEYLPEYYDSYCTVDEPCYCKKKKCRKVPKYYEVQCIKYQPVTYTKKVCRMEDEFYEVEECTTRKKRVCIRQCKYVPRYCYKRTPILCGNEVAMAQPTVVPPVVVSPPTMRQPTVVKPTVVPPVNLPQRTPRPPTVVPPVVPQQIQLPPTTVPQPVTPVVTPPVVIPPVITPVPNPL